MYVALLGFQIKTRDKKNASGHADAKKHFWLTIKKHTTYFQTLLLIINKKIIEPNIFTSLINVVGPYAKQFS